MGAGNPRTNCSTYRSSSPSRRWWNCSCAVEFVLIACITEGERVSFFLKFEEGTNIAADAVTWSVNIGKSILE